MIETEVLAEAFERIKGSVHNTVHGLTDEQLAHRIDGRSNSIGWLVWHLTRVQDDHVAGVAAREQVWIADGWVERFGLPFDERAHGYGHSSDDVAAVQVSAQLLLDYYDAVHAQTLDYLGTLSGADLDRVVDEGWDPPVTLGVRLISVVNDDLQHVGQAAFVRGLL
jgi:hypothetical protein